MGCTLRTRNFRKFFATSDIRYWVNQLDPTPLCRLADRHGRKAGMDWKL